MREELEAQLGEHEGGHSAQQRRNGQGLLLSLSQELPLELSAARTVAVSWERVLCGSVPSMGAHRLVGDHSVLLLNEWTNEYTHSLGSWDCGLYRSD